MIMSPSPDTTARSDWAFRAENVTKTYDGEVFANDAITIEVEPGEVYGLLGPNGAGKTTFVKQVIGLLKPTSGSIRVGPYDLVEDPDVARQLCSYLPQAQMPIQSFKMHEAVHITGLIRGGPSDAVRERGDALIEALDLTEWRDTLGHKLSGGVRRLVGFIMTTVWPGKVVILDEPTNDVDPRRRRLLWEQIRLLGSGGAAVFLVTHNVLEAEKAVDRLAIINEGRLIAQGTPSSLKSDDRGRLRLQLMLRPGNGIPELPTLVHHHARVGNNLMMVIDEAAAGAGIAWAQQMMEAEIAEEYALGATTLEDVYIRLTGHTSQGDS
ncbi:MAG TPA: ABC transporter ATP-binding protein [Acidimicrobiia bacterium]|nr:ABC transporter ATP-binding protein [Acidimicrobiia bacterium]